MTPARPLAERLRDDRVMGLALVAAVVFLRAPGFAVRLANIDECDFALFGRMVRAGAIPYLGVADIKPPLTYFAYHVADLLGGGHSMTAVRLLGVACVVSTALLLRAAARAWTGDDRAGWAAAWLSVIAICCESPAVNAEILMNVPVAAAILLLVRAERTGRARWDLASGAAIGIASLVKHQAGIAVVALVAVHLVGSVRAETRNGALRRAAAVLGGFASPWVVTAAIASQYDWASFYYWVVTRNLHQVATAQAGSLARGLAATVLCLGTASLAWAMAVRRALRPRDGIATALILLAALTWIPVSIGGRFYEHYFLQFAPPLAVLGAPELVRVLEGWEGFNRARRSALAVLAIVPLVGSTAYATYRVIRHDFPAQDPKAQQIASWLTAHTKPEDRVFLWGDYSVVYCLADRLPGTRYMRTAPHVGDFDPAQLPQGPFPARRSEQDVVQTLADLESNRPLVVVDTSPADLHGWSRFPLSDVAEIDAYVRDHYELAGHPAGAAVYVRRPEFARRVPSR